MQGWVALTDRAHMPAQTSIPNLLCYEELIDAQDDRFEWPAFDERTAAALCYTSGTTGNPKGVLYSHRSTVLHAYGAALPDALDLSARDVVLPVVPMFHVNAWGLPYACAMVGAKLVFPGPQLDGKSLLRAVRAGEGDAVAPACRRCGSALLQHLKAEQAEVLHAEAHGDRRLGLRRRR